MARASTRAYPSSDTPTCRGRPSPCSSAGWETALDRNISFIVNRINERVLAGQSIETLLAVLMFVMMGITLDARASPRTC